MTDRSVRVQLSASVQGAVQGFRQAEDAVKSFARQGQNAKAPYEALNRILDQSAVAARKLGVAGNDIGRGFGAAVGDVSRLAAAARDLAAVRLTTVATDFRRLATALSGMGTSGAAELARLATAMRDLTTGGSGLTNFARDLGRISSALRSFAGSASATTALRDITPALHALGAIGSGTLTTAATDIRRIATAVRTLSGMGGSVATINDIAAALARLGHAGGGIGNLGGINAQLRALQAQIDALRRAGGGGGGPGGGGLFGTIFGGAALGNLASNAISTFTSSLVSGVKDTVKATADFETTIQTLGAVTKTTGPQLQKVSDYALKLGADITIANASASDAAVTMTALAKGGFDVAQSMAAAKGTLQLAGAAGIDFAKAAEIETSAIHQFGLSAADAGRVADVLVNTAHSAGGSLTDYAEALKVSGVQSKQFGLSIEEASATLGVFAQQGIKGQFAGTILKDMLSRLTSTSKPAQAAFKELGVTAFDSTGKFEGWDKVVNQLSVAHGKLSEAAFDSATQVAFGSRSVIGATILATKGTAAIDAMAKKTRDAAGAAAFSAAKMQGLGGAFANLQNQIETAQVTLGEKFSPALQKVLKVAADFVPTLVTTLTGPGISKIGDFFKPLVSGASDLIRTAWPYVKNFVDSLGRGFMSIVTFVKPVADAIGNFWKTISDNGTVGVVGEMLTQLGKGFEAVLKFIEPVGAAIGGIIKWVGGLPTPLLHAVAALGLIRIAAPLVGFALRALAANAAFAASAVGAAGVASAFGRFAAFLSGPWGLAVAGAVTALAFLSGGQKDAGIQAADFSDIIDAQTGKLVANAAAIGQKKAADEGVLDATTKLGLGITAYSTALLGTTQDQDAFRQSVLLSGMNAAIAAGQFGKLQGATDAENLKIFTAMLNGTGGVVKATGSAFVATGKVINQFNADTGQLADTQRHAAQAIVDTNASLKDLYVQKTAYPTAALVALHNGVADVGKAAATTKSQVADLVTGGIRVVTDSATGAIFATDQISSKLVSIGANSKGVIVATTNMSAAYGRYQTAASEASAETGLFLFALRQLSSGGQVDTAQAIEAQGAAIRAVGASLRDQAAATDAVTTATDALATAQKKETDKNYTAEQKTLDVAAAQRTLAAATADSAASQDKNAQAGRSLQETTAAVMVATANAANAHGGYNAAVKAGEQVMVDARAKFVQQIATFGGTTAATKESTKAAEKLADQYGLIPKNVKTILDADPKLATEHAADVKRKLDAVAAAKYEAKLEAKDNVSAKITIVQAAMDAMRSKTITLSVETSGGSAAAQAAMDAARTAAAGTHATGGGIYGAGPKGKDSVLSWLAPGEHVFTDKEVDKMGGQGAVYAFRKNLMAAPGLAAGGALAGVQVNMDAPGANAAAGNITSFFSRITSAVTSAAQSAADAAAAAALAANSSVGGSGIGAGAARAALTQLGVPYVYAAEQPGVAFDCSGLTQWAYRQVGIELGRYSGSQAVGTKIPQDNLIPGDLSVWDGHVNMYVGNGNIVEAPQPGDVVHVRPVYTSNEGEPFKGFWRPYGGPVTGVGSSRSEPAPQGGGTGVERWRGLAMSVAAAKGENAASVQVMLNQMSRESSGNERAINLTDSNAQAGHPSVGLLQFIPSTFQNYADPGFNSNIYDPASQMHAWYNYINRIYGGYAKFATRGYGAYADGGLITSGTGPRADDVNIRASRGEFVVNANATRENLPWLAHINGGYANGGVVLPSARNLAGYGDPAVSAHLSGVLAALDAFASAVTDARSHVSDLSQAFIQAHSTTFNATGADKAIAQKKEDAAKAELNAAQHHINTLLALQNAEQRNYRALQSYASRTDALTTRLGVAQANLDSQRSARASLAGSVSSTSTGFGGGLTGHADTRDTFATFLKGQQYDLMQEVKFKDQIKKLGKLGFDSAGLADLAGQGAEAGAGTATALLQGGKGGIGKENLILRQMRTVGKSVGDIAGDAMYGAGIKAGQGLVNGINSQLKFIARASQHLADVGVLRPFAKALAIHSPSQVFHGHGQNIAKGLEQGMISRYDHVNRAVAGMVTIPRTGGGGGSGTNVEISIHGSDDLTKMVASMITFKVNGAVTELTQSVNKLRMQPA